MYDQLYDEAEDDIPLDDLPHLTSNIALLYSASATFYATSEECGTGGMHREIIRSNPSLYGEFPRYDTVIIQNDSAEGEIMGGMIVGRVKAFLSFTHDAIQYPCALVDWFIPQGEAPDPVTRMWILKPETRPVEAAKGLVHLDCIVRACHLSPVFGRDPIPPDFHFSYSLDAYV